MGVWRAASTRFADRVCARRSHAASNRVCVGQYVDLIVLLYPLDSHQALTRARQQIEYLREQLHVRAPGGVVAAGISRPVQGLRDLRAAYREAKDSLTIAQQHPAISTSRPTTAT
ncbi:MAG: hypothetical protein HND48_05240 [Chloroflexi bacterium]|nr:hypothetical protein [Chloroflexota bacterium]